MKIDPLDIERRRLERMDAPSRITWLRDHIRETFKDSTVCSYFRMPPPEGRTWKEYAIEVAVGVGLRHGMQMSEITAAIKVEWANGIEVSIKIGDKFRVIALSHLKIGGPADTIHHAFRTARRGFPSQWPPLGDDILEHIAAGFRPRFKLRGAA